MIRTEQLVEQLTNAARGCSPADLSALLDHSCGDSTELRHLVEERLTRGRSCGEASTLDWAVPAQPHVVRRPAVRPAERRALQRGPGYCWTFYRHSLHRPRRYGRGLRGGGSLSPGRPRSPQDDPAQDCGDAGSSRRFEQEVSLARKVSHPNLCPIYDIARSDDPPPPFLFLTMKLLTGETLSSRLRRSEPIPRQEAIAIFRQMVAGLAAIHAAGVIHRDIKPNNVMLDYSGPGDMCFHHGLRLSPVARAGENDSDAEHDGGNARLHGARNTARSGSFASQRTCSPLAS